MFSENHIVGNKAIDMIKTLQQWMMQLGVREEDIVEKFVLGQGSGGQKINKTSSCVYIHHKPTGIQVKCQQSRSREANRQLARHELCRRIEEQRCQKEQENKQKMAKLRRQNRKRSAAQKEKLVANKRKHSSKKTLRQKPSQD